MPRARATSEEEAANLALVLVREAPIADLAADEKRALTCRTWFATVRDGLLEDYDWHFARAATVPAAIVGTPVGRFTKRYPLPADCLAVRFVATLREDQWEVVAGSDDSLVLATDATAPLVHYTARISAVALWAPQFLHYFAQRLAAAIAPAFGKTFAAAEPSQAPGKRNAFGGEHLAQVADAATFLSTPVSTEAEAANLALVLCRQPPIGSLNGTTGQAAAVRAWFTTARDEVLGEHEWNFATKSAALTTYTAETVGPFTRRYTLPTDLLVVRRVEDQEAEDWSVEGGKLLTDIEDPTISYTAKSTTVSSWEPAFVAAFATRLASYIAPIFQVPEGTIERLERSADKKVGKAARRDAREGAAGVITRDTSWIRARRGLR